jgi:probable phosphoglycerate mutase
VTRPAASVTRELRESTTVITSDVPIRLHLVRHGETLFNIRHQLQGWCDSPLTPRGQAQVRALGEHFAGVPLVAAFCSDLTRTRDTAAGALAGHAGLALEQLRELREWHFGGFEGQPNAALWDPVFADHGRRYGEVQTAWTEMTEQGFDSIIDSIARHDPLGQAETAGELKGRIAGGLDRILGRKRAVGGGDVLVVTHGAVLGSILHQLAPEHPRRPGFPNCGVVTVEVSAAGAAVGEVDDRCALLAA